MQPKSSNDESFAFSVTFNLEFSCKKSYSSLKFYASSNYPFVVVVGL